MTQPWYSLETDEVLSALDSGREGLSVAEAGRRLQRNGPNILREEDQSRMGPILLRQFTDVMILILFLAAGIAAWMGDWTDAELSGPSAYALSGL
jgi:magnesium-transporting ATPase (P-type)